MAEISGIYVKISGDYSELRTAMTRARGIVREGSEDMANKLNNAVSPAQMKRNVSTLIYDLQRLQSANSLTGKSFDKLGVDLKEVQHLTGLTEKEFQKLQQRMAKTTAAQNARSSLQRIAKQAGLSRIELASLQRKTGDTAGAVKTLTGGITEHVKGLISWQGALGLVAGAAGIGYLIKRNIEAVDTIGKTADKIGFTTDQLQELRFAAEQSGVDTKTLDMAMQRFSRRLGEVAQGQGELLKTAQQYGVQVRDNTGKMRSNIAILEDFANIIKNAESEQEALRISFKLFDSEGAKVVNMLRNGAGGMNALRQEARDLGIVLDEDLIRNSEKANDALNKLERVVGMQLTQAVASLSPDIAKLATDLIDATKETAAWIKALNTNIQEGSYGAFLSRLLGNYDVKSKVLDDLNAQLKKAQKNLAELQAKASLPGGLFESFLSYGSATGFGKFLPDEINKLQAIIEKLRDQIAKTNKEAAKTDLDKALAPTSLNDAMLRVIETSKEATKGEREFKAARIKADREAAKIALEEAERVAKERPRLAREALNEEKKAIADEVAFNLKAMGKIEDSWMLAEQNRRAGSAGTYEIIRKQEKEIAQAQQDYALAMAKATGDSLKVREIEHKQFVAGWAERGASIPQAEALWNAQMQKDNKSLLDKMLEKWTDTNQLIISAADGTVKAVGDIWYGFLDEGKLDFESFGDAVVDAWKRMLADMLAAWTTYGIGTLIKNLLNLSNGGSGGIFDGILNIGSGKSGGAGGVAGTISSVASVAGIGSKIAGWLGIGGGAASAAPTAAVMTPGWAGLSSISGGAVASGGAGGAAASGLAVGAIAPLAATLGPIAVAAVGGMIMNAMAEQMSPEEAMKHIGQDLGTLGDIKAAVGDWDVTVIADTAHHLDLMATRAGLTFEQVDLLTLGMTGLQEQMDDAAASADTDMNRLSAALQGALDAGDFALAEQIRTELDAAQAEYEQTAAEITASMAELAAIGAATGFGTAGYGQDAAAAIEAGQLIPDVEASLNGLVGAYLDAESSSNNLTQASRSLVSGLGGLVNSMGLGEDQTADLNALVGDLTEQFLSGDIQAADLSARLNDELVGALTGATEAGDLTAESIRGIGDALSELQQKAGINLAIEATWMDGHGGGAETHHNGGWLGHSPQYAHGGAWIGLKPGEVPMVGLFEERVLSHREIRNMGGPAAVDRAASGAGAAQPVTIYLTNQGLSMDNPQVMNAMARKLETAMLRIQRGRF